MNRFDGSVKSQALVFAAAAFALLAAPSAQAQSVDMTFFVTSSGPGKGADLGGLEGADAHCQKLAQAAGAGAGAKSWRAYLSTQAADGKPAINARDRIGKGPWQNAKGAVIAKDVADLHGPANNLTKQTALSEKGEVNNGAGDTPNRHDILTGSQPDGTAFARRRGQDLQELVVQRARCRGGRPCRPEGPARRRAVEILEQLASLARPRWRLLAGRLEEHRRRRAAVLLRVELRRGTLSAVMAFVVAWLPQRNHGLFP
ncbi:hypothetical protein ACVWXO_006677 [Bradyrhizobium sp. LM2.7]